jgi:Icc-related predicted phosphoesterase
MRILSVSDMIVDSIYSPSVRSRFSTVDLLLGCGDMPYYYFEYILNALNCPAYFVRGNHARVVEYSECGERTYPHGAIDMHRKVITHKGLIMAGVEGCLRYRPGPFQYTSGEMWNHVFSLVPALLSNRVFRGRALDVFVTHAPPAGINDRSDLPHRGVPAFRWFLSVFKPTVHLHGHIHLYRNDDVREFQFGSTQVINTYGYRTIEMHSPVEKAPWVLTT